ncbi:MAG TPA: hypothetical protein VGF73_07140 [Chthoniobacterales bacterium]|jgi:hypothetical protein
MTEETKNPDLEMYLQDHYAGAVGAIGLIEHLRKVHTNDDELEKFFSALQAEIEADHQQLHNLMTTLRFEPSSVRNAGAWMAEKFGRMKLGFAEGEENLLRLLQALETIYAGITGKRLLWRALHAARDSSPVLRATDFSLLEQRAMDQAERVESKRLSAARRVLAPA